MPITLLKEDMIKNVLFVEIRSRKWIHKNDKTLD